MTPQDWARVLKEAAPNAKQWIVDGLADAMPGLESAPYEINTKDRQAHFLAQVIHESDGLRTTQEYASGSAYEGRKDLGNVHKGDGVRFKGRGLIQLTGRVNYQAASTAMDEDFVRYPEKVERFPAAATVSAWFWDTRKLNRHADAGDIRQITRIINGALTHLDRRQAALDSVRKALA